MAIGSTIGWSLSTEQKLRSHALRWLCSLLFNSCFGPKVNDRNKVGVESQKISRLPRLVSQESRSRPCDENLQSLPSHQQAFAFQFLAHASDRIWIDDHDLGQLPH